MGRLTRNAKSSPMTEVIQAWIEQLLIAPEGLQGDSNSLAHVKRQRQKHPLPSDVMFVFCQYEACVIGKCDKKDCRPKATLAALPK